MTVLPVTLLRCGATVLVLAAPLLSTLGEARPGWAGTAESGAAKPALTGPGISLGNADATISNIASTSDQYLKYYVVRASYNNRPETLREIAARLLGEEDRASAIFELNKDRIQPDGARLTDPDALRAGWLLALPWDAVGDGVEYGLLPEVTGPPPAPPRPTPPAAAGGGPTNCVAPAAWAGTAVHWAQLRLTLDEAWARTRGQGVTVAVIDSGVDGSVPALAGRVLPGSDAAASGQRGDRDCLGHGTALAGILAARSSSRNGLVGVAPEATILPVRITMTGGTARPDEIATAVELALTGGATVVMIAVPLDGTDGRVAAAIQTATDRDAVVVLAAPPVNAPAAELSAAALRVGAVGADDQPSSAHPPGSVDVLAPGVDIVSLGIGGPGAVQGTGADFAVPFVAGLVALVRAAEPTLSAPAIVDRVMRTADRGSAADRDPRHGWGVIDPSAAVTSTRQTGYSGAARRNTLATERTPTFVATLLTLLALLALGFSVWRRPGKRRPPTGADGEHDLTRPRHAAERGRLIVETIKRRTGRW